MVQPALALDEVEEEQPGELDQREGASLLAPGARVHLLLETRQGIAEAAKERCASPLSRERVDRAREPGGSRFSRRQPQALQRDMCDPVGRACVDAQCCDAAGNCQCDPRCQRHGIARQRDRHRLLPFGCEPAGLAHRGSLGLASALHAYPENVSQPPCQRRGNAASRRRCHRLPERHCAKPASEMRKVREPFDGTEDCGECQRPGRRHGRPMVACNHECAVTASAQWGSFQRGLRKSNRNHRLRRFRTAIDADGSLARSGSTARAGLAVWSLWECRSLQCLGASCGRRATPSFPQEHNRDRCRRRRGWFARRTNLRQLRFEICEICGSAVR